MCDTIIVRFTPESSPRQREVWVQLIRTIKDVVAQVDTEGADHESGQTPA